MVDQDKLLIRVKLCGNCNPYYDVKIILKRIKQSLNAVEFIYKDDQHFDLYLIINSCLSACVEETVTDKPIIIVRGYMVNGVECKRDTISGFLIETIKKHLSK